MAASIDIWQDTTTKAPSGRPKGEEVGMVNNTTHRRRGPAVRPKKHEETLASIFLYLAARGTQ